MPVAIPKPHWKNALGVPRLRHDGVLTETERRYLEYLKRVDMVGQDRKHFYALRQENCSSIRDTLLSEFFVKTGSCPDGFLKAVKAPSTLSEVSKDG